MKRKPPLLDKPIRRHRPLSEEEMRLWKEENKSSVRHSPPIPSPRAEEGQDEGRPVTMTQSAGTPLLNLPPNAGKRSRELVPAKLDKPTHAKIRRGGKIIEATLDLHGHTRVTAYSALLSFIETAHAGGIRLALVITGKGRSGGGALRELLPRWLEDSPLRERIIAYDTAGPRHGGEGAWYVRIRK